MFPEYNWDVDIKAIGVDVTPVYRIARWVERYDSNTLNLIFTLNEIEQCQVSSRPYECYAICFAAKEAVGKALGTGLCGIEWGEIEACVTLQKLSLCLYGKAAIQSAKFGIKHWLADWLYLDQHILVQVLAQ
jgi:holo-[acyl-carrier protein] synthase